MVKLNLLILFMFFSTIGLGQSFPKITTTDLNTNTIDLPTALQGKKSILFIALTKKAEDKLTDWYEPVYMLFLDESGFNAMAYDCNIRLLMLFTGPSVSMAETIKQGIVQATDPSMASLLLFSEGSMNNEFKELGISKSGDAYVFVLDERGSVLFKSEADYSDKLLEKIADFVELD